MPAHTLLLLGASGFLGPHVVFAAHQRGWRVAGASPHARRAPPREGWFPDEVHDFEGTDARALEALLDSTRPQALLNAAALARIDACERDPARAAALNAALPGALACQVAARGLRLVHVSTDLVFGARAPRAARYAESDAPSPVHAYGRSKAEGEERVLAAHPAALVVRLPLLYGDSLGRALGAGDALLAALARGERPALFVDEWRTPLEVGNAARALVELLERSERGFLHVAGPARLSRHELGLELLAAQGSLADAAARVRAAQRAELGLAALRPSDTSLDASRARALLATPLLAPREALARTAGRTVP